MKALVIDDSKAIRRLLTYFAGECSFETEEACDGQEAMEALDRNGKFDLALVDWDMPRMNGLDFVKAVRAKPEFSEMKLMMVTTQNSMEKVALAIESGANDFLMKPLTKEMFEDKLKLLGFSWSTDK